MAELKTREPFITSWPDEKGRVQGAEEGGISEMPKLKAEQKETVKEKKEDKHFPFKAAAPQC